MHRKKIKKSEQCAKDKRTEPKKRYRQTSISTRLFMSIMAIVLSFILTVVFVDTRLMNGVYIFSTAWQLWDLGDSLNNLYNTGGDDEFYADSLLQIENENSIVVEIFDQNDFMIYSSDSERKIYGSETDQSLRRRYEVISSSDIGSTRHFEIQQDMNYDYEMQYIVYVVTLDNGYLVKAYKMKSPIDEGAQIAVQTIIYTSIGLVFIAAIFIRFFSLKFTAPLKKISLITRNMAELDFSERCPTNGAKEICMLSDSVNDMAEALNEALEDLKQKNKKLMDDYEKEKTLEHLRYDFISGVSHELKTPIAIIQGYAEGMELFVDSDPEAAKQYAGVIVSETGRMHTLVMKLLEIIKYDSGDYVINREEFNINELVQDWFKRESNLLAEKNITYENVVPLEYKGVGDALLLSSVLNNYLSNAVSHADDEKKLIVSCEDLGGVFRISVFNTGKRIADRDIDKIWDSFYRADKSLSREEGRFGLGLAIVSSIQRLHGREFGVKNEENGVKFWFDIEKADN